MLRNNSFRGPSKRRHRRRCAQAVRNCCNSPRRALEPLINAIAREFPAKSDRTFFPEDDEPDGLLSERVVALIHNIPSQPSATVPLMRIFLEALFSLVLVSASLFSTYWVQNIMQPAYFASL